MKREISTREKILLVILAVLMIAVGYFKLVLTPINEGIDACRENMFAEQDEITEKLIVTAEINKMQVKIDEIMASGEAHAIPYFDNSTMLMIELHSILCDTDDYSLSFGNLTADDYIMMRPVAMSFKVGSYEQARAVIDALYASDNIMKISDINISMDKNSLTDSSKGVQVSMNLTYYELIVEEGIEE